MADPSVRDVLLAILIIVVIVVVAFTVLRRFGPRIDLSKTPNGDVPVRCRDGHIFTTDWIPGVSFHAVRLGRTRYQWCPVGEHWSFVTRVDDDSIA